jgi:hypothetical protein
MQLWARGDSWLQVRETKWVLIVSSHIHASRMDVVSQARDKQKYL